MNRQPEHDGFTFFFKINLLILDLLLSSVRGRDDIAGNGVPIPSCLLEHTRLYAKSVIVGIYR